MGSSLIYSYIYLVLHVIDIEYLIIYRWKIRHTLNIDLKSLLKSMYLFGVLHNTK